MTHTKQHAAVQEVVVTVDTDEEDIPLDEIAKKKEWEDNLRNDKTGWWLFAVSAQIGNRCQACSCQQPNTRKVVLSSRNHVASAAALHVRFKHQHCCMAQTRRCSQLSCGSTACELLCMLLGWLLSPLCPLTLQREVQKHAQPGRCLRLPSGLGNSSDCDDHSNSCLGTTSS